jgi:exopolyphosphatase / guanosine-5'-triphosphate,3'-diphosphate pyrophosphatase
MNYASIDIGTNAVLLLIMGDERAGLTEVFDTSTITRLGEGLLQHGSLSEAAMERTLAVLERYRAIIDTQGAKPVCAFGTSALREAKNGDRFGEMARERAGLEVTVISEYQEAFYAYLSVARDPEIEGQDLTIVDIGGGSTEISRATRERLNTYVSVPIGTVKLTELFIAHDPPQASELSRLIHYVHEKVPPEEGRAGRALVGLGGTVTTLAAIVLGLKEFDKRKIHGLKVSAATMDHWIEKMCRMTTAEKRTIPGMERGREDILLQGMVLMREIMRSFAAADFVISTYGGRYGVLYEMMEKQSKC